MNCPYIFVEHNGIKQGSTVSISLVFDPKNRRVRTGKIIKEHSVRGKITIHKQQWTKHSRVFCNDTAGVKWEKETIKKDCLLCEH